MVTQDVYREEPILTERAFNRLLEWLDNGVDSHGEDHRALVIEYYRDARRQKIERRRDLAKRLGITMNALSIRVSRIRATLEASVEICRKERRQM